MSVSTTSIRSILLAAGRGERLRPLTDLLPKAALPVLDVPLGAFMLADLCSAGGTVVVNLAHLGHLVESSLSAARPGCDVEFVVESPEPFGTAGTLAALRNRCEDGVLAASADVLADIDLQALLEAHAAFGAPATIAVVQVAAAGDFVVEQDRAVEMIDRRVEPDRPGVRYSGVGMFGPEALALLPEERPAGLGETVLRTLAGAGELAVVLHRGYWLDVGNPARYLQANLDALYGRAPRPPVTIAGRIMEVEGGRAYLGPGADAQQESLGPGAILLHGATVDPGAHVENAMIMPSTHVPAGERIAGAVRH